MGGPTTGRCAALTVLLLVTAACTGDTPAATERTGGGASPSAVAATPHAATTASTSPASPSRSSEPVVVTEVASGDVAFASPSGNILCFMSASYAFASCRVEDSTWRPSPRPANCDGDWGPDIDVGPDRPANFRCATDAVPYDWKMRRRLAYGHDLRVGSLTCSSRTSGISCRDPRSQHGFTVNRAAYDLR